MGVIGSEEVVTERGLILVDPKATAVVLAGGSSSSGGGSPPPLSSASIKGSRPPQVLVERLKDYGQEDVFAFWEELSPEERDLLLKEIQVCANILFFLGLVSLSVAFVV